MNGFLPTQLEAARNISSFGELFWSDLRKEIPKTPKESLEDFLISYAFERQGSPRAYRTIAKRAIDKVFTNSDIKVTANEVKEVWKQCKKIRDDDYPDLGLNESHHPLKADKGVLRRLVEKDVSDIWGYVSELLKQDKISEAYCFVYSICGVGHKITALYLRDMAHFQLTPNNHYYTEFQPIDTWLDQSIDIIKRMKKVPKKNTRNEKRQYIIDLCEAAECSPIDFNSGAWYSGSIIAQDYGLYQEIIQDKTKAIRLIGDRINERKQTITAMEKWIKNFQ